MSRIGVYPGSFDPVTNGHLDILQRALRVFDSVVVAIVHNPNKQGFFTHEERAAMLSEVLADEDRIEIDVFSGLLVDYVEEKGAQSIIRGLRAVADFEFEFQMASMNRRLKKDLDTIFLMTDERHFYVSSSLVKEVARLKGDISQFVPPAVAEALNRKFTERGA